MRAPSEDNSRPLAYSMTSPANDPMVEAVVVLDTVAFFTADPVVAYTLVPSEVQSVIVPPIGVTTKTGAAVPFGFV